MWLNTNNMKSQQTPNNMNTVTMGQHNNVKPLPEKRVNISNLISRYKKEKAKEKTETFIFVGLACALILVSGIIVSL